MATVARPDLLTRCKLFKLGVPVRKVTFIAHDAVAIIFKMATFCRLVFAVVDLRHLELSIFGARGTTTFRVLLGGLLLLLLVGCALEGGVLGLLGRLLALGLWLLRVLLALRFDLLRHYVLDVFLGVYWLRTLIILFCHR